MAHPQWRELERLIDDDDLDGVLAIASVDDIAKSWCSYNHREHTYADDEEDPDWWAVSLLLDSAVYKRGQLCRNVLDSLIAHATDDDLGAVGAGPLENFTSDDDDDLRWLEQRARVDQKWRTALSGMWVADYLSDETMSRLDAAVGEPLPRPRPREEWPPAVQASEEAEKRLVALAGPEWYSIEDPTPEQSQAISEFLRTTHAMLENRAGRTQGAGTANGVVATDAVDPSP